METTPKPPETPPTTKPRNKNLVLIGIVIVVLIVVGVGAYYLFNGGTTQSGTPITIWDTNGACLQAASPPDCGFKTSTGSTTLNVTAGTKVTWTNTGGSPHTATSCDQAQVTTYGITACPTTNAATVDAFTSPTLQAGSGTYSFTFSKTGTYHYFCTIHVWMHGTVNVQ
jgi:plastocyanin